MRPSPATWEVGGTVGHLAVGEEHEIVSVQQWSHKERRIMLKRWSYPLLAIFILLLAGCGSVNNQTPAAQVAGTTVYINKSADSKYSSTVRFTLAGGANGSYTVKSATALSMLRHGHKEFTIDVAQSGMVIFLAFYGYHGPGTYKLAENIDGGDVHIALGYNTSWDLSPQTATPCILTISSDTPTTSLGIDHMTGSFSCSQLSTSNPADRQAPIKVVQGTFTIAMLVVS